MTLTMPFLRRLLTCGLAVATITSLFGAPATGAAPARLFSDNFEEGAEDALPEGDWTGRIEQPEQNNTLRVRRDREALFERGFANRYLEIRKETSGAGTGIALQARDKVKAEVVTFVFSFYEPAGTEMLDILDLWVYRGQMSVTNAVHRLRLGRGRAYNDTSLTFGYDQQIRVEFVLNNSADEVAYGDGETVAPGTADLWVNGELWSENSDAGRNSGMTYGPMDSFQFNLSSAARGLFFLDDIYVLEGAHIGFEPPLPTLSSYARWRENFFSAELQEDAGVSGPAADPDGTGVPNLLAYASASAPGGAAFPERPRLETVTVEGERFPALSFRRVLAAHDVDLFVEVSDDLVEWRRAAETGAATRPVHAEEVLEGVYDVVVGDRMPLNSTGPRFLRLNLEYYPDSRAPELDPLGEFGRNAFVERSGSTDMFRFADDPDGGSVGWGASVFLNSYLAAYSATGDRRHMRDFHQQVESILANRGDRIGLRDAIRDRVMPAWISSRYTDGSDHAWLVHSAQFIATVSRWVYVVERDPQLQMIYGHLTDGYIAEIKEVLEAFEDEWKPGPGTGEGHYVGLPNAPESPLPFNMQHAAGRAFVGLWLLTGEEVYRQRATEIAAFWKNRVTTSGDRYSWTYAPGGSTVEDISHGGLTVLFAVDAYRAGFAFDLSDMDRLAGTFAHFAEGASGFRWRVDGSGSLAESRLAQRWLYLGLARKDVRDLYFPWFENNWMDATPTQMVEAAALLAATSLEPELEEPLPDPR